LIGKLKNRLDGIASRLERLVEDIDGHSWPSATQPSPAARVSTPMAQPTARAPEDVGAAVASVFSLSLAEAQRGGVTPQTEETLDKLCKAYGVHVEMPVEMGEARQVVRTDRGELVDLAMVEEGVVGTPTYSGRIQKEPTGKYAAFTVRGSGGNAGLYEEYWASESQIYDAVQGHIDSLASGAWEIEMPRFVAPGMQGALQAWVDFHNAKLRALRCMEGGFATFIEHAGTFIPMGFSLFEPVFTKDSRGRWYLSKMGYREQSTVDEWYLNERGDKIEGVQFKTNGDNSRTYTLHASDNFLQNHLVWFGIGAYGSNFEGRPPTRPALHWVKMKRLIAQIVPLSIEKYGVPIAYIKADTEYLKAAAGGGLNYPNLADAYDKFKDARAVEGPVFKFADGVTAEIISPPGVMPDLHAWIAYCDQMIGYPFSNEGNLLGMQSAVGSYAQAEVKERRFMRSAPGYARKITDSMNAKIYEPMARYEFGPELVEAPRLVYRADALMDAGSWLANARQLFGPNLPLEEWPARYQRIAHEKMGIPWTPKEL
jgi:hypothetical protein